MPAFLLYNAGELRIIRIRGQALGPLLKRRCLHSLLSFRQGRFVPWVCFKKAEVQTWTP